MPKKRKKAKRRARRNPSTRRKTASRVGGRLMSGLNIRTALKDQVPIQIGMLAAKWAEKRFGPDASDLDPASWNWSSYAKGGLGAVLAGMLANAVKPGMGQKVLTGGLSQVLNRLIRNELIEKSPFAVAQLGQADDAIVVDEDGTPYMGADGEYLPLDETYREEPGMMGMGELEPVGPLGLGDSIVTASPLGDDTGDFERYQSAYAQQ